MPAPSKRQTVHHNHLGGGDAASSLRAFTLVELLVTLAITVLLLGLLLPGVRAARGQAQRIECSSNLHQIGLSMMMYASSHDERLPETAYARGQSLPAEMMAANVVLSDTLPAGVPSDEVFVNENPSKWDGLGLLVGPSPYLSPRTLYCPSHHGEHTFERYESLWPLGEQKIVVNYQYRGHIDASTGTLRRMYADPGAAIVADGMKDVADVNHSCGCCSLHADGSTCWWYDERNLLAVTRDAFSANPVQQIEWYDQFWAGLRSK